MSTLPFRCARALLRVICGLPSHSLETLRSPVRTRDTRASQPRSSRTSDLAVAASPDLASRHLTGFVRLEVDQQKKATGCLLLFADGQVLTAELAGDSEPSGRFVAASFQVGSRSAESPRLPRPVPTAWRQARFQVCDH